MNYKITNREPYRDPHSNGTGSIVTQRQGYVLRTRGEHNRLVRHDYRCPIHGVFEAMVSSGEVPDKMSCPAMVGLYDFVWKGTGTNSFTVHQCGELSPWQYPTVGQGISAGSVKS